MDQIKNTQTYRAPPDYVTNLVPMVCYFAHFEQSLKGEVSLQCLVVKWCCGLSCLLIPIGKQNVKIKYI